jgi:hypothetical protein
MATGDDIVPGDVFKQLIKCGLRTVTQQTNNICELESGPRISVNLRMP